MTEDNCSMTDISKLILNKHKIMSGKYFTRQQLMDCIVSQQERISKLREALKILSVLSVFGVWKIIEIAIWLATHIEINL